MLSETVRRGLMQERARFARQIELIDELLAEGQAPRPTAVPRAPRAVPGNGHLAGGSGLREAIRGAVAKMPGGARPRDVERFLRETGYKDQGDAKTALLVRVGNELWRLHDRKELRKEGGLYFSPQVGG
jgi:hypothetical protein